ncbi:MAG TPA: molybdate ABC transporter permease subunit [Planctomycetota bacterium]|nr:molybdate ABC transporter permease subunit [Planctomycetota bacterium]
MIDLAALLVSAKLAAVVSAVLLAVGLPLAWWLARSRSRVAALVETVVALPLVLPPVVLGFYLLLAFSREGPFGALFGDLPFTFAGIVVGATLVNLPVAVRPWTAAFAAVDRRYAEAAWCLGASRASAWRRVTLPLAARGLAAGLALTFAHTLGEFGVVLMLGGAAPGVTRTLSVAVFDQVQAMDYGSAAKTSLVLLAASAVALAIAGRFVPRGSAR